MIHALMSTSDAFLGPLSVVHRSPAPSSFASCSRPYRSKLNSTNNGKGSSSDEEERRIINNLPDFKLDDDDDDVSKQTNKRDALKGDGR